MTEPDYSEYLPGGDSSAVDAFSVSPSDSAALDYEARAIYVGGLGDLAVVMKSGAAVTFVSVPAGAILPIRVTAVKATGTTATDIVGLR